MGRKKTIKNIAYGQFACVGWMLMYSVLEVLAVMALFIYIPFKNYVPKNKHMADIEEN